MDHYEFNRQLADAARAMAEERDTGHTLQRAVQMATDMIEHCDLAGISVVHADRIDTPAASHEQLRLIDEYQYECSPRPRTSSSTPSPSRSSTAGDWTPRSPNRRLRTRAASSLVA